MNIAGALAYLVHTGSAIDEKSIAAALEVAADERVGRDVLTAVRPIAELLPDFFRPLPYEQLRGSGRAGLFHLPREQLDGAFSGGEQAPPSGDRSWAKAVDVGDDALVYPQDARPDVRVVLWAPILVGLDAVRLAPLDLGIDVRAGTAERPAVEPEPCGIVFTGSGASLRKTCAPGSCNATCDREWRRRSGTVQLFGCSCPEEE